MKVQKTPAVHCFAMGGLKRPDLKKQEILRTQSEMGQHEWMGKEREQESKGERDEDRSD